MNTLSMAQVAPVVNTPATADAAQARQPLRTMAYRKSGYSLYQAGAPLHACDDLLQARGWLLAEWERDCYYSEMAECKPRYPHPRVYTDDEVYSMMAQSESSAEMEDAIWRSRGW